MLWGELILHEPECFKRIIKGRIRHLNISLKLLPVKMKKKNHRPFKPLLPSCIPNTVFQYKYSLSTCSSLQTDINTNPLVYTRSAFVGQPVIKA